MPHEEKDHDGFDGFEDGSTSLYQVTLGMTNLSATVAGRSIDAGE